MSPALAPGDALVARRLRRPRRGRILFFPHPHRSDFWLVKRIVGLPGEVVVIADGGVTIDGTPLVEPWAEPGTGPDGSWTVPERHVFVLSDARRRTVADSRTWGPIGVERAYVAGFRYHRARR